MLNEFKSVIGDDVEVTVEFYYTPEQPEIRWPNDSAQPYYEAEIDITGVYIGKADISIDLSDERIEEFKVLAMEHIANLKLDS